MSSEALKLRSDGPIGARQLTGHIFGILFVCLAFNQRALAAIPDLYHSTFCSFSEIRLSCSSSDSLIAIHEATFTTDSEAIYNGTCSDETVVDFQEICSEDVRLSLNGRCAGAHRCSYNYSHDHLDKLCLSPGIININYACVSEKSILKYCNYPSRSYEGYISSPGYPSFFPSLTNCTWTILADEGQTISLRLLDVYLRRPKLYYGRYRCEEAVSLYELPSSGGSAYRLAKACGQSADSLKTYETSTGKAIINFSSEKFTPFRGFLLYYRLQGCPTLPPPNQGYMVYRNGSTSLYMCCKGHLFNDTLDNIRYLYCQDEQHWNSTLPNCQSFEELRDSVNSTFLDFLWNSTEETARTRLKKNQSNMLTDIIIPSALMASLILGNAVVFIIIMKIRRKTKHYDEDFLEEEDAKPSTSIEPQFSVI